MKEHDYLNIENIEKSDGAKEYHPLKPFLPKGCKVLFLGSFPPQRKRWCMDFYYPNFLNDHWRIEGLIFFGDKNHFVDPERKTFRLEEITRFLNDKGIGLFDTATVVRRLKDNASDKFLEVLEPTDIRLMLQEITECRAIAVTGEKAATTLCEQLDCVIPKVGSCTTKEIAIDNGPDRNGRNTRKISIYRLPSSSRAYPLALDKKADEYRKMFEFAGIL